MTTRREVPVIIDNFAGLNRRDGADKVLNNQFLKLQNFYPHTKNLFYKRNGSISDLTAAQAYGASKIDAVFRHYDSHFGAMTLYSCVPNQALTPFASINPATLTEIPGGDLFGGGAVVELNFTYTWVGLGNESKDCATFHGVTFSHIASDNTKGVRVTLPAFPQGVIAANVFIRRPTDTAYSFVGTTTTGILDVTSYIGTSACRADAIGAFTASPIPGGSLPPGQYYIALAWAAASAETFVGDAGGITNLSAPIIINTASDVSVLSAISVSPGIAASANGAKYLHVFIGKKHPLVQPMMWAGIVKHNATLTISSYPEQINAQTGIKKDSSELGFYVGTKAYGSDSLYYGFFLRKNSAGLIKQVNTSRTEAWESTYSYVGGTSVAYIGIATEGTWMAGLHTYSPPSIVSFSGSAYMVNGLDVPVVTDGYSLGFVCKKTGTALPPFGNYLSSFKGCLILAGGECGNQAYYSNANDATSWVVGGAGTALQFVTIGDAFGDGIKGSGIFSYTSGTDGPKSLFCAFKKSSIWSTSALGLTSIDQLSGRVGTVAPDTIKHTPIGLTFLGNDGNIYLLRGGQEPVPIGGSVKPLFEHLVGNDALMSKCSASFHGGFYKIHYPSAVSSLDCDAQLWGDFRTEPGIPITWCGPHTGMSVGRQVAFTTLGDASDRIAIRTDGTLGVVKLDDTSSFQDLGTTITSVLETKQFRLGDPMHEKRVVSMILDAYYDTAYSHRVLMELFADEQYAQYDARLSTGGGVWGTDSWDLARWSDARFVPVVWDIGPSPLVGRMIQARITHADNAQFILAAIGITMMPERRRITRVFGE